MPKPELEKIGNKTALRQLIVARRTAKAAQPSALPPPPAPPAPAPIPNTKTALGEILERIDDHRDPLMFSLESRVPVVGPVITAGKSLLRLLMRSYIGRQSSYNAFLLEMSRVLAVEQERRLNLVESRLARMEQSLLYIAAEQRFQSAGGLLTAKALNADGRTVRSDASPTTQLLVARKVGAAMLSWETLAASSPGPTRDSKTPVPCLRPLEALGFEDDPLTQCLCLFEDRKFVLTAGCGSDDFLALLHGKGVKSMGVNYCPACCDKTRGRGASAMPCDILDYLATRPEERALDGLVCANLVEHHAPADVVRLLSLANRAMSIGSPLVITSSTPLAAVGSDDVGSPLYPLDILVPLARVSGFEVQPLASV
jgi:hypothetical protein